MEGDEEEEDGVMMEEQGEPSTTSGVVNNNAQAEEEADIMLMMQSRPALDVDAIASAKSLGEAMRMLAPQLEGLPRRPRGKYGKRKNLTAEEKTEIARKRNRENAKSTRTRRKMYIEHMQKLSETLKKAHEELSTCLVAESSSPPTRRRAAVVRFLELRCKRANGGALLPEDQEDEEDEKAADAFFKVLTADCVLTLPATPYRPFPLDELDETRAVRVVRDLENVLADTDSLRAMLAQLAERRRAANFNATKRRRDDQEAAVDDDDRPRLSMVLSEEVAFFPVEGDVCMCKFQMAIKSSIPDSVDVMSVDVMADCRFAPDDRIAAMDLRFDTSAVEALLDKVALEVVTVNCPPRPPAIATVAAPPSWGPQYNYAAFRPGNAPPRPFGGFGAPISSVVTPRDPDLLEAHMSSLQPIPTLINPSHMLSSVVTPRDPFPRGIPDGGFQQHSPNGPGP